MQEYHLDLNQIGDLTFKQFSILTGELERQSEEIGKAGVQKESNVEVVSTHEDGVAAVKKFHAMGMGNPKNA